MEINLLKYNRHWEKGFFYPYPKKRQAYTTLIPYLAGRQILEITGLRRVGKSTLLFQMINQLIVTKVDPYNIIYFTFDEYQPKIEQLLQDYQLQTGLDYKKEKIYIFLDEIQKLDRFASQIKVFFDLYPNLKFILSGSTSLFIRKKTQESLAGRIFSHILKPLDFHEYLFFIDKQELLRKPKLYKNQLDLEFNNFLSSQFIESLSLKSPQEKKEYFNSILRKIIFEDLPSIFRFDNPQILYRLAQFIAQKPGALINNLHLAAEMGVSNKTVALYLSYLEDAFIVKKLYNFSRNLVSSEKRLKKYYLASPSFSHALVDFPNYGGLFENYIISVADFSYFFRDPHGHEVDFVQVKNDKKIIPLEAKFQKKFNKSDFANLLVFMKRFQSNTGYILYNGIDRKKISVNKKDIHLLPYTELSLVF